MRERGLSVDEAGFHAAMQEQKNKARAAGKFKMDRALEYSGAANAFIGYSQLAAPAKVLALYADGTSVESLNAGQNAGVVLDSTPFYAESGGQVGDQGQRQLKGLHFAVHDTQNQSRGLANMERCRPVASKWAIRFLRRSTPTCAATMRNHSATHIMHVALREVLGSHVQQKGSLVNAERTRFDFTHNAPVSDAQMRE